jgi:hypothetical protein
MAHKIWPEDERLGSEAFIILTAGNSITGEPAFAAVEHLASHFELRRKPRNSTDSATATKYNTLPMQRFAREEQ